MEKVILLADKNSNSWDFAEKIQNYIKSKTKVKIPLEEVSINILEIKKLICIFQKT